MGSFITGISNLPPQEGTLTGDPYAPFSPGGDAAGTWYDPAVLGTSTFASAPPMPQGGFGSLDMGSFLNSIGNAIKNFLPSSIGFGWLWWLVIGLVVLLFAVIFTTSFGKGIGEGLAARA